jgi:hypothetical protein
VKDGAWINSKSGQYWWVDEHCMFASRPADADKMGLPQHVREQLAKLNTGQGFGPDREAAIIAICKAGYIRFRGHGAQLTCEFWGDTYPNLWACYMFLKEQAGAFSHCVLNNLKTNEQIGLQFQDFEKRMQEDEASVMRIAKKALRHNYEKASH